VHRNDFRDGKSLKSKYGLRPCHRGLDIVQEIEGGPRKMSFSALIARMPRRQKISAIRDTVKWAVADKKKFAELVQHLYDFIGDLERLTQHWGIPERQQMLVQDQIESISDIPTLENMEASRIGRTDKISDAASERLQRLCGSTQSRRGVSGQSESDEFESSRQTYTTAPEELPSSESIISLTVKSRETTESNLNSPEPHVAQNERIMADLLGRIPSSTDSQVKPIDASSVGTLITAVRRHGFGHIWNAYPLSILYQPFIRPTASTSIPRTIPPPTAFTPAATNGTYRKRILQELRDTSRLLADYVHVEPINDSLRVFLGSMEGPPGSPYHGGIFHAVFIIPKSYPMEPPYCRFITKVYHPNIDLRGRICFDILNDQWGPSMTLTGILISIVSLLDDPGIDGPLVPEIAELFLRDKQQYQDNVRSYTQQYAKELVPTIEMVDKCLLDMAQLTGELHRQDSR
jgi:ubiquitin-conjugating enzyme E2 D